VIACCHGLSHVKFARAYTAASASLIAAWKRNFRNRVFRRKKRSEDEMDRDDGQCVKASVIAFNKLHHACFPALNALPFLCALVGTHTHTHIERQTDRQRSHYCDRYGVGRRIDAATKIGGTPTLSIDIEPSPVHDTARPCRQI